jgi:hypothetical protein
VHAPHARSHPQDAVAPRPFVDAAQELHRFTESRASARSKVCTRSSRIRRAPS